MLRRANTMSIADEAIDLMGPEFQIYLPLDEMGTEEVLILLEIIYADVLQNGLLQEGENQVSIIS